MRKARIKDLKRSLALLALLGFAIQYPIPELHECPRLQPELASHPSGQTTPSSESSDSHKEKSHQNNHDGNTAVKAPTPPCHSNGASSTEHSGDAGHQHESCPVCQGYLTLGVLYSIIIICQIRLDGNVTSSVPVLRVGSSRSRFRFLSVLPRPPPFR